MRERVAAGESRDDAGDRDNDRGAADLQQLVELGVETDEEQQQDDAELREEIDRRIVKIDEAKPRDTDDRATDELTENRRLANALRQLAEELGGDEDRDERKQKRGNIQTGWFDPVSGAVKSSCLRAMFR